MSVRGLPPLVAAALVVPPLATVALLAGHPVQAGSRFLDRAANAGGDAPDAPPAAPAALPALPLPLGARLMAIGDSQAAINDSVANGAAQASAVGLIEATWQADPRFNFDSWADPADPWSAAPNRGLNGANQGINGDHLAWSNPRFGNGIMGRMRYAIGRAPQIVWLDGGTNTINSGDQFHQIVTADYVTGKLDRALALIRARGAWTILSTLYPRGDWPVGDRRHEVLRQVNSWIRAQAGRPGVKVYDPVPDLVDPANPDRVRPDMFVEGEGGVHLSASGVALVSSRYLLPLLRTMVAPGTVFDTDPARANLFPASTYGMAGSAGRKVGVQTSGEVATGYTLRMTRGDSTQVASKEPLAGALQRQVLTIAPSGTTGWHQSTLTFPALPVDAATLKPGAWVRAYVRVDTPDARSAATVTYTVAVLGAGGEPRLTAQAGTIDSNQYQRIGAGRGVAWLATKPFQMPADAATIAPSLVVQFGGAAYPAGSRFRVIADSPILRVSADPRPAWNLP